MSLSPVPDLSQLGDVAFPKTPYKMDEVAWGIHIKFGVSLLGEEVGEVLNLKCKTIVDCLKRMQLC